MSRAVRLRNQALKLAMSDNQNLLSQVQLPAKIAATLARMVETTPASTGRTSSLLLVGGSTPELPAFLAKQGAGGDLDMRVIRHHSCAGASASDASQGSAMPVVHTDLADYALDPERLSQALARQAPGDVGSYLAFVEEMAQVKARSPWIPDGSVDVVVQDFTANLLAPHEFRRALGESFRVLALEGTLSVIALLADEPIGRGEPVSWGEGGELRHFPQEAALLGMLQAAGFHGMSMQPLVSMPVVLMDKCELRAYAITAYKGTAGPCLDQGHAVIYRGPWREVSDDDGHVYRRGVRMAVCAKTYGVLQRAPYRDQVVGLPAYDPPALENAPVFDCNTPSVRDPAVTKGFKPLCAPTAVAIPDAGGCCDTADAGACCETGDSGGCC